jgi:outer membrane protein TolC
MNTQTSLLLLVSAGCVSAVLQSGEAKSQEGDAPVRSKRVQALLVERRNTLGELYETVSSQYASGTASQEDVIRARDALLRAELRLTATVEERLKLYEQRVETFRELERHASAQFALSASPFVAVLEARAARLAAEIELELARDGGA